MSVRSLTDENGVISDAYIFDAFGNETESTGTTDRSYGFQGEEQDATGLYYLRARYMDPSTGTFTSMDTYGGKAFDPVSLHKYLFANSNPVKYKDPSGHASLGGSSMTLGECMLVCNLLMIMASAVSYVVEAFITPNGFQTHNTEGLLNRILKTMIYCLIADVIVISLVGFIEILMYEREISEFYYHVTTSEKAQEIMKTGQLGTATNRFESKVFAFRTLPTKAEALAAGLGDKAQVVLKFTSNASWEVDTYVDPALQSIAVRTTDGQMIPINIGSAEVVDFYDVWRMVWEAVFG